jgi:hypothetical protein
MPYFGPSIVSFKSFFVPSLVYLAELIARCLQMRVDGARFRLRDARIYSPFQPKEHEKSACPVTVIREYTQREETVESLAQKGLRSETHNFADPNVLVDKLKVVLAEASRLKF